MKMTEALRILHNAPSAAPEFPVTLVCGFTSLHLETFLRAHLQQATAYKRVRIETGLYGDLAGTLEAAADQPLPAIAVTLEWPDIDARLGYRQLGGWGPADIQDILANSARTLGRIQRAIERIPSEVRLVVSLPTLPLAPAFHTAGWQASEAELELRFLLAGFGKCSGLRPNVIVLNESFLAECSPPAGRFDLKSELLAGLPYSLAHADALGAALASALLPAAPKKGLITDLDGTLWSGIVGEIGPAAVSWDLASHSQLHGIYQQYLRSLSERGVLIGIASKNDAAVVDEVFARPDILLPVEKVFPMEVHWRPKSGSVERILRAWNISADSVVFIDDNPMELAEVKATHPGIECIRFPDGDYSEVQNLLRLLRDLFGKSKVNEEDAIRLNSLRQSAAFRQVVEEGNGDVPEEFLAQANATLLLDFRPNPEDPRALELVNKTNQFNLNGLRYTDTEWRGQLKMPGAFLLVVGYQDRFGPLGKIAVLQGRSEGATLHLGTWVMSCRAFARRIEYACLEALFRHFLAEEMRFSFVATSKNGPLRQFLAEMLGAEPGVAGPQAIVTLTRENFLQKRPPLYHIVNENHG